MGKIILASASEQRKKLFELAGMKFTVNPSKVEEKHKVTTTCVALVKHNALIKAQDVAQRVDEGIVIGADTVVYAGNKKIIGKPRDLKQAKIILKQMFVRPHWVYTGVAVIDAKTKKKLVDYEKTKIYMNELSDNEIDLYHQQTTPLDKAGGFDIEGRGGFFINRIEGCYSNVIGLPMAKLRLMLKEFGVTLLSLFMVVCLAAGFSGCSTEYNLATGQQETMMYGTDKEISIGDAIAVQMDKNYEINTDVDVNERVQRILDRIVEVCDRKELVYSIKVINEDKVNAVSLPGGHVYIFKGLIDRVENDDQLAGVIAHEVGHITAKHGMKRLQASYGYTLLQVLSVAAQEADMARGVNAMYTTMFFAYSRKDEFEADRLSVKYIKKAGYDPDAIVGVLELLNEERKKAPLRPISYFRTHPYVNERIAMVKQEIYGSMDFKDYLNVTGNEL